MFPPTENARPLTILPVLGKNKTERLQEFRFLHRGEKGLLSLIWKSVLKCAKQQKFLWAHYSARYGCELLAAAPPGSAKAYRGLRKGPHFPGQDH